MITKPAPLSSLLELLALLFYASVDLNVFK